MNPFEMIKNMQNIKGKIQDMQSNIDKIVYTASNVENVVSATVNGKLDLIDLKINPSWAVSNPTLIQNEVKTTIQAAIDGVKLSLKSYSSELTGGLDLSQFGFGK